LETAYQLDIAIQLMSKNLKERYESGDEAIRKHHTEDCFLSDNFDADEEECTCEPYYWEINNVKTYKN